MSSDNPYDEDVEAAEAHRSALLRARAEALTEQRIAHRQRLERVNRLFSDIVRPELALVEQALLRREKNVRIKQLSGNVEAPRHIDPEISLEIQVISERVVIGPKVWFTSGDRYDSIAIAYTLRAQMPNNFGDVFPDFTERVPIDDLTRERVRHVLRSFVTRFFR